MAARLARTGTLLLTAGVLAVATGACSPGPATEDRAGPESRPASRPADREAGGKAERRPERRPERLVGAWHAEGAGKGEAVRFGADGTGTNADGSGFEWRLEGDALSARRRPAAKADGGGVPAAGEWTGVPIRFTRDGKEFMESFEGGKRKQRWFRLKPDGTRDEHADASGAEYPDPFPEPKEEDDAVPTPRTTTRDSHAATDRVGVTAGPNVRVSAANGGVDHGEVILAIDPDDSRRMVAGSMHNPPPVDPAATKVIVYTSGDGGATWAPSLEHAGANPECRADPAPAFGPGGVVYFADLLFPSLDAEPLRDAVCLARSRDGGATWAPAATVSGFHDRPFLAADRTAGRFRGRLYCTTASGLFVSSDEGRTFGPPVPLRPRQSYQPFPNGNPVVLSDGTVVVLYGGAKGDSKEGEKPEAAGVKRGADMGGYLAVRRSTDGGASFSEEATVARWRVAGGKFSNLPTLAVDDRSQRYKDHLYAVWIDGEDSGGCRVMFARSADGGASFGKPVVLSEQDAPAGGAARGAAGADYDAFLPCVAVSGSGAVAVSWYDTRSIPAGETGWDLRLRVSLDGGETWGQSVKVNDGTGTLGTDLKKRLRKGLAGVGHTSGLAADSQGRFHPLWVDGRTGVLQVWTATVSVARQARRVPSARP